MSLIELYRKSIFLILNGTPYKHCGTIALQTKKLVGHQFYVVMWPKKKNIVLINNHFPASMSGK